MAHEDALNMCRTALAHLNDYMARMSGQSWASTPAFADHGYPSFPAPNDSMHLLKQARDELGAYISRMARVDELADVVVTFDGARLPVQVEYDEGEAYPSHVFINGAWIDVAETWFSVGRTGARFQSSVQQAMRSQANIDSEQ